MRSEKGIRNYYGLQPKRPQVRVFALGQPGNPVNRVLQESVRCAEEFRFQMQFLIHLSTNTHYPIVELLYSSY